MKTIYDRLDGYRRDTNESFRDFFAIKPEERKEFERRISPADINFFDLMAETGEDLSAIPMPVFSPKIKKELGEDFKKQNGKCHDYGRKLLYGFFEIHRTTPISPRLYFGVVDVYKDGVYRGMFIHSFLTHMRFGDRVLVDALSLENAPKNNGVCVRSHFGIRLPYGYVADMFPRNYSYDIKNRIIHDRQETLEFMKMIKVAA